MYKITLIMTFSINAPGMITFSVINDAKQRTLNIMKLCIITLNILTLSIMTASKITHGIMTLWIMTISKIKHFNNDAAC
jgi:hypothetical protein